MEKLVCRNEGLFSTEHKGSEMIRKLRINANLKIV